MEPLTLDELERQTEAFDAAVRATPEIDTFCSSSVWALPAHQALMPRRTPYLWQGEDGYIALAKGYEGGIGHYLQPLEAMWGFCSGVVSTRPDGLMQELAAELARSAIPWNIVLLNGLTPHGEIWRAALRAFGAKHRMGSGMQIMRHRASLEGGADGFLSRRSRKFRQNLRRAERLAAAEGVSFERVGAVEEGACDALYKRVLAVERLSWKWAAGGGLQDGRMQQFYAAMLPRLAQHGAVRATFARRGGADIAYILGGALEGGYRGLQMSFDHKLRHLSLGNLLQWSAVQDAAAEGLALYDLGGEVDYKEHWSDDNMTTMTLAVFR